MAAGSQACLIGSKVAGKRAHCVLFNSLHSVAPNSQRFDDLIT